MTESLWRGAMVLWRYDLSHYSSLTPSLTADWRVATAAYSSATGPTLAILRAG